MTGTATITFSQTGVRPPVYVTTSLSGWTILDMDVEEGTTASDNLIFIKEFSNVAEGNYQYKIRIGEDHWVLDEAKETATDNQGIRNNVVTVESAASPEEFPSKASPVLPIKLPSNRKDSTVDQDDLPPASVPQSTDQEHPVSVDAHQIDQKVSAAEPAEPPESPLLVVEKTDDEPTHGDDSGEGATNAQKAAHDMRTADASPGKLLIIPEPHAESDTAEEQTAPLFRHESFQADQESEPSMGTIDEECGDAMDTPPEQEEAQNEDELKDGPLLQHETGPTKADPDGSNGIDPNHAPLFPHETDFHDDSGAASEAEESELDRYPLLSHEAGFSDYKGSEVRTYSDLGYEGSKLCRSDIDEGEPDYPEADNGDAPLLPHERDSAVASNAGSDLSQDEFCFSLQNQPTFGYETDNARDLFGGHSNLFSARISSNLPHKLPQSDAEDENLNDPSLEQFPTTREQILQRVATIGQHLPEDESMQDHPLSPQPSVLSQACSSVDLMPVKSCASLASVPEVEYSDDEEDKDVDSLPSPVYLGRHGPASFARDTQTTPMPNDSKQLGISRHEGRVPIKHTPESSEASVDRHDGAKDVSHAFSALRDAISTPAKMMTTHPGDIRDMPSQPMTMTGEAHPDTSAESEIRRRRAVVEDAATKAPVISPNEDETVKAFSPALAQQLDERDENLPEDFIRAILGPVRRFLAACVGTRKRASVSAIVLGAAAAVYYYGSVAS